MTDFDPNEELHLAERTSATMHDFRMAIATVGAPLHWPSVITEAQMYARPIDEEPNYAMLQHQSVWSVAMRFSTWGMVYVNNEVVPPEVTYYRIDRSDPMAKTIVSTNIEVFSAAELEKIVEEHEDIPVSDLQNVETHDIYRLIAAGISLGPIVEEASRRMVHEYITMTDTERYLVRMAKYEFMFADLEVDKSAGARWWGVSVGRLAYAIYASSPEEACVMLEDELEPERTLLGVIAHPYDEEGQKTMSEIIGDAKKLQRLIPNYDIPWPDSLETMTEEQRIAFRDLGYEV